MGEKEKINLLSVLLPVYNEERTLKIMVQILESTIEIPHEILIIYDSMEDKSIPVIDWLMKKFPSVRSVYNDTDRGVINAVRKGVKEAKGDVILISAVDEVFPVVAVNDMLQLIGSGCDLVSCTRYALGGKRYGGSFVGGVFSYTANKLFRMITGSILSDLTTGFKMMKKDVFNKIEITSNPIGWAFAFELSVKAQLAGLKMGEVPIVSIDRLFGGSSTFKFGPWLIEYLRWFLWGIKNLKRSGIRQKRSVTIERAQVREDNNG